MKIINDAALRVPIKMWLDDIEEGALDQARDLAKLPFVFSHVVLMPDSHQGYGMPIGGVLAAEDTVIPNAVGVDIGCGMKALKTNLTTMASKELIKLMDEIKKRIPLGFKHHKTKQKWEGFERFPDIPVIKQQLDSAKYQIGTLGGGNHFIEIQKGSDGYIWIMIHSGSRNFGLQIAQKYNAIAKQICQSKNISLPNRDLAFLSFDTEEANEYMDAMNYALEFARENRSIMMRKIIESFSDIGYEDFDDCEVYDIHHNYAAMESHFGRDLIIHRKGATSAKNGQIGIIPGSQGTKSYIVKGKGNKDSFMSCSHGAGRKMGRKRAIRELNIQDETRRLDELGIIHSIKNKSDLGEAPGAYKDIDTVMENQKDLVEIEVELSPLAVIKG